MLSCYKRSEYIRGFVFQSIQLRFESSIFEYLEYIGRGTFGRFFSVVRYQFGKDGISVKIKENK